MATSFGAIRVNVGLRARCAIAAAAVVCSAGCAGNDTAADPLVDCGGMATERYAVHDGVPVALNSLDVYRPAAGDDECSERPLVVWVHGGGWTEGDKAEDIEDKVRLFTDAGYAFASINYRLTDPDVDPATPRYPVHDEDGAAAFAWLVEHAEELGVDTDRIALLGHSAGGGITAAVATDESFLGAHDLDLDAIRCAGSIDGEGYDVTRGATHPDPNVNTTYLNAFGDDLGTWAVASPMNHVAAAKGIPSFFVAARGTEMRIDLHAEFVNALRSAGIPVEVVDSRELDHAEVSDDIGAPGDTIVTPALMEFLGDCFTRG